MAATAQPQHIAALATANERRMRIAALKSGIRSGDITLAEIMANPPEILSNWSCADVIRARYSSRHAIPSLERLGRLAVRDRVNLLVPLGRASARTRTWVAEHATWDIRTNGAHRRLYVEVRDEFAA